MVSSAKGSPVNNSRFFQRLSDELCDSHQLDVEVVSKISSRLYTYF